MLPFTVEFSGSPRAGKTSCIQNIHEFFKKGGFNVFLAEEIANLVNQRINDYNTLKSMSKEDYNDLVAEETLAIFKAQSIDRSTDIVLFDRGILDRYIWYYLLQKHSAVGQQRLEEYYNKIKKEVIDFICITACDPITSLKRDHLNSLTLEPRKTNNIETLTSYNEALYSNMDIFKKHSKDAFIIETDTLSMDDVQIKVLEKIMTSYGKKVENK